MKTEKQLKAETIREWSPDEIKTKEREIAEHLFRLKFQFAAGQTDLLPNIRLLRRNLARVKTILREKQLETTSAKKS